MFSFPLFLILFYIMLFSLVQIRADTLKLKKIINRGLYWSYGFKSRHSYVCLPDITRWIENTSSFKLSMLYLNYDAFRKWKILSWIIHHLTNSISIMSHKKKKVLLGKERSSNPQKQKWKKKKMKAIIYKENNFGFISEIKRKTYHFIILSTN